MALAKVLNNDIGEVRVKEKEVNLIDVTRLIAKGRKGITNAQMIPAIKNVLIENDNINAKLTILFNNYTEIFISSAKYVPDKNKLFLEKFIQEKTNNLNFQLPIGKKLRYGYDEVEENEIEVLEVADKFNSSNNAKLADLIKNNTNWKNNLSEEEIQMVKLALQDKSTTEVGSQFGYNKDKVYTILFRNNGKSILNKLGA